MGLMKDYLMRLEELAWDAIEQGANSDEEIYAYISNWFPVDLETVKQVTRQMYMWGPDGVDNPDNISYN